MIKKKLAVAAAVCAVLAAHQSAFATEYEITVTNLTSGLHFTPLLVSAHPEEISIFHTGEPSSVELQALAEGGDTTALAALLESVSATVTNDDALLAPGESRTFIVSNADNPANTQLSIAGMLLPTNDGFVGLNSLTLPTGNMDGADTEDGFDPAGEIATPEEDDLPGDDTQEPGIDDSGAMTEDPQDNDPGLVDDSNPEGDTEEGDTEEGDTEDDTQAGTDDAEVDDPNTEDTILAPPAPFDVVEADPQDTEDSQEADPVEPEEGDNDPGQMTETDTDMDGDPDAVTDPNADDELFPDDGMFVSGESVTVDLLGYDAGTEGNNEVVGSGVPGEPGFPAPQPVVDSGVGSGATGIDISAEGFVHVHRNVLGDTDPAGGSSDINSAVHRWLNPVARVTVTVVGETVE